MQNIENKPIPHAYERYIRRAAGIDAILERLRLLEQDLKEQHELNNRLVKVIHKMNEGGK